MSCCPAFSRSPTWPVCGRPNAPLCETGVVSGAVPLARGTGCESWLSPGKAAGTGSGQRGDKGLGEEGDWELGVSDPTRAWCGGAVKFPVSGWLLEVALTRAEFLLLLCQHSQLNAQSCSLCRSRDMAQQKMPFQQRARAS